MQAAHGIEMRMVRPVPVLAPPYIICTRDQAQVSYEIIMTYSRHLLNRRDALLPPFDVSENEQIAFVTATLAFEDFLL
jgi:hypothetical protein